jgi:hypothetical protein
MAVRGCSVVAIEALEEDQATSESMTQSHMVTSQFLGQTDAYWDRNSMPQTKP